MSKSHHWRQAGVPLHLESRGAPTAQEEMESVKYFADGAPLNRAMRRHQERYFRKLAKKRKGGKA